MKKAVTSLALIMLCMSLVGCSSRTGKLQKYIKDRYNENVTYDNYHSGTLYRFKTWDNKDLYISYNKVGKDEYISDNFMAIKYKDLTYNKIKDAIDNIFSDSVLYFTSGDSVLMIDDWESYTLEDYLADSYTTKSIIVFSQELDKYKLDELVSVLGANGINLHGVICDPVSMADIQNLNHDTAKEFLSKSSWVTNQVNFAVDNGELIQNTWKYDIE